MELFSPVRKRIILAVVTLTIFLDFFNLGLVFPIFNTLSFDPGMGLLPEGVSVGGRNVFYSLLIVTFAVGQFIGAPLLGSLSDRQGRRRWLLVTVVFSAVGMGICAWAVFARSIIGLFIGRLVGGIMAGNMTIGYSAIADCFEGKERTRNFAVVPLATGLGFVLGPYLAGVLASATSDGLWGLSLPFIGAFALTLVNIAFVYYGFPETYFPDPATPKRGTFDGILALGRAMRDRVMVRQLVMVFLTVGSNYLFCQFLGALGVERFGFAVGDLGLLYFNVGLSVAIGQGFLFRMAAKVLSNNSLLGIGLGMITFGSIGVAFASTVFWLQLTTTVTMLGYCFGYTAVLAIASGLVGEERQGEIMGISMSLHSLGEILPALVGGAIAVFGQRLPILGATALVCGAALLLWHTVKVPQLKPREI